MHPASTSFRGSIKPKRGRPVPGPNSRSRFSLGFYYQVPHILSSIFHNTEWKPATLEYQPNTITLSLSPRERARVGKETLENPRSIEFSLRPNALNVRALC